MRQRLGHVKRESIARRIKKPPYSRTLFTLGSLFAVLRSLPSSFPWLRRMTRGIPVHAPSPLFFCQEGTKCQEGRSRLDGCAGAGHFSHACASRYDNARGRKGYLGLALKPIARCAQLKAPSRCVYRVAALPPERKKAASSAFAVGGRLSLRTERRASGSAIDRVADPRRLDGTVYICDQAM